MSGLQQAPCGTTARQVIERARRCGAGAYVVDGAETRDKAAALDAIGRALSFPAWYGHNLDALYDCLTDLSWLPAGEHVLVWSRHRELATHDRDVYEAVMGVLADAAETNQRLTVVLTDG
ncbi:barstar family protein [Longimycelium tulufanense]|uniref:barstar family protein n=1 Tax=Longimycelium tulufanense TaxID=907463 RepID=UPI0016631650